MSGPGGATPSGKSGSGDARSRRWRGHREARRAALVEAAVVAIRRHGPDVGMEHIAAEAGVTKPILYRHFADKADLWVAVGQRMAEELLARIGPALEDVSEHRERVAAVIDAYLATIEAEPQLYQFVMRRAGAGRPVGRDPVADHRELIASALARVIGDRARALGLDAGGAEPFGHGLVGLVESVGDWWLRNRQPVSREGLTEYLTALIWSGLSGLIAAADLPIGAAPPAGGWHDIRGASGAARPTRT